MNDAQPFLDAICANPAEDAPRLVFADWLEERGECTRAEFIRVQCELESIGDHNHPALIGPRDQKLPTCRKCGRQAELECLESKLFDMIGPGLRDAFPWMRHTIKPETFHRRDDRCCLYSRGFVSSIHCTLADWCGGPCEKCNGEGGNDWDAMNTWNCTACGGNYDHRGTGTTTGHADEICLRHPIESVTLTDRRPHELRSQGGFMWSASNAVIASVDYICQPLLDLLDGATRNGYGSTGNFRVYPTEADALAALDRAAVKLGRERAAKLRIARQK